MKRKAEAIMYALFFLAALPLAWMAVHEFFFFISNPSALESRETHREAALAISLIPFSFAAFVPAVLTAVYLFIFGKNATRAAIAVLAAAYVGTFSVRPDFSNDVVAGLAWDASMMAVLALTPLLLLAILVMQRSRPNSALNSDAPQSGAPVS
jgi:hypothetical protein